MLTLQNISYTHPDKTILFQNINLSVNQHDKVALIGDNGTGKSTLLKIIAGKLTQTNGTLLVNSKPYYVPQISGQFNNYKVCEAMQIASKLGALQKILSGDTSEINFEILNDDWNIEERSLEALSSWGLSHLDLNQKMGEISGGEQTKVFLSSIQVHQPELILLDEPSNHLDLRSMQFLYDFIESTNCTMLVVSHDIDLLRLLDNTIEIDSKGIKNYGGNYDFYLAQKQIETQALTEDLKTKEKELNKAKEVYRKTLERKNKSDAQGKKKHKKAGVSAMAINTMKDHAEKSTSKTKGIHTDKIGHISNQLGELRGQLPDDRRIKFNFDNSDLHKGKILAEATDINFTYNQNPPMWENDISFTIRSGDRIVIAGDNGSGKTTLLKLINRDLEPIRGSIKRAIGKVVYIDQHYSLLRNDLSIYQQAQEYNINSLEEHEVKIRLDRFLFSRNDWDKRCACLSGGEKMRLIVCCLNISNKAPDIIALDEPTNNLDITNVGILSSVIREYDGTVLVISHNQHFLREINVEHKIDLK